MFQLPLLAILLSVCSSHDYLIDNFGNGIYKKISSQDCNLARSGWSDWIPASCTSCGQTRIRYCRGTYDGCGEWYCLGNRIDNCDNTCPVLQLRDPRVTVSTRDATCGTTVRFACPECYTISGKEHSECLVNNTWTAKPPICKAVSCSAPPSIENGYVLWGSSCNSKAEYTCYEGYELSGPKELTCTSPGRWEPLNRSPICMPVECPKLSAPKNGFMVHFSRVIGSRAFFRCKLGYDLLGPKSIKCGTHGKWSELQPVCVFNKYDPWNTSDGK